jgi:uncharacterized membrane protein
MATALRAGILVAAVLLGAGLVAFLVRYPSATLASVLASNPIAEYLSPPGLLHGLTGGRSEAFLTLGILVLVATPLARVALGGLEFARSKDRPLAVIAATVLALLLVGIFVLGPLLR